MNKTKFIIGATIVGIIIIVIAITGQSGLYKGDLGSIVDQKTPVTEEICKGVNAAVWVPANGAPVAVESPAPIEVVTSSTDVGSSTEIGSSTDVSVISKTTGGRCEVGGQSFEFAEDLRQYAAFATLCRAESGTFGENTCSILIAGSLTVANSPQELELKLLQAECANTPRAVFSDNKCEAPEIGSADTVKELRGLHLQYLCTTAKYISREWTSPAQYWAAPAEPTCSFAGTSYTNYSELSTAIEYVRDSSRACVAGGGTSANNTCSLDNTALSKALCKKAWQLGWVWKEPNTCSINSWEVGDHDYSGDSPIVINKTIKNHQIAMDAMKEYCLSIGGTFPYGTYCVYNNKLFFYMNALRGEKEASDKTAAEKAVQESQVKSLNEQLQAAQRQAAENERIANEKAATNAQIQNLQGQLQAAQNSQNNTQIDALNGQINTLTQKLNQLTTVTPPSAPAGTPAAAGTSAVVGTSSVLTVCEDPSFTYDAKKKACVAPSQSPTLQFRPSASASSTIRKMSKKQLQDALKALMMLMQ